MRTPFQLLGLFLVAAGISGCVDHLAYQPIFGAFLNVFNRFVIPRIDALAGYELFANLGGGGGRGRRPGRREPGAQGVRPG